MLTSEQAVIGEDGSSRTLDSGTSNGGASLPNKRGEMKELRDVRNSWIILAVRNVGSLTIVPLVGNGISNQG
jgi:hypothetical protein